MNGAREQILGRVRAALRGAQPAEPVERAYRRRVTAEQAELVGLLQQRLADYKAEVRRVAAADVGHVVAKVCSERAAGRIVVPPGVPGPWLPAGVDIVRDAGLTPHELDELAGVLTACTVAVAETGTLVLTAGPAEGRRALTLVPDLHICVVEERQVVADVPAAMDVLAPLVRDEHRPLTFISGPSATSDIELQRVEGVHGPRQLVVVVAAP